MMGDQPPGLAIPYGNDVVGHNDQIVSLDRENDDYYDEQEYDNDYEYEGDYEQTGEEDYENDYYDYEYNEGRVKYALK